MSIFLIKYISCGLTNHVSAFSFKICKNLNSQVLKSLFKVYAIEIVYFTSLYFIIERLSVDDLYNYYNIAYILSLAFIISKLFPLMVGSYQSMSDKCIESIKLNVTKRPDDMDSAYGGIIWLVMFLIVQILEKSLSQLWIKDDLLLAPSTRKEQLLDLSLSNLLVITPHFKLVLYGFLKALSTVFVSVLNSLYSFEPLWISLGYNTDDRYDLLKSHSFYFIGFGLPMSILGLYLGQFGFLYGYASFLIYFPITVIIACSIIKNRNKTSPHDPTSFSSDDRDVLGYVDHAKTFAKYICNLLNLK